jgi:hypothetical protein
LGKNGQSGTKIAQFCFLFFRFKLDNILGPLVKNYLNGSLGRVCLSRGQGNRSTLFDRVEHFLWSVHKGKSVDVKFFITIQLRFALHLQIE